MSTPHWTDCYHCGDRIIWLDSKPVVPVGNVFIEDDDTGRLASRKAYLRHDCSGIREEAAEASREASERWRKRWEKERLSREEIKRIEKRALMALRDYGHEQVASEFPCARCDAPVGELCWNLTERRRGNAVRTRNAHEQRVYDYMDQSRTYPTPGNSSARREDRAEDRTQARRLAESVRCPNCKQEAGEPCIYMESEPSAHSPSGYKKQEGDVTRWPHAGRAQRALLMLERNLEAGESLQALGPWGTGVRK